MLMAIYSAGLQASETLFLKPEQLDSERMLIKVTGKEGKQRYTFFFRKLLPVLRDYYNQYCTRLYLFPSPKNSIPLGYETIRTVYEKAKKIAWTYDQVPALIESEVSPKEFRKKLGAFNSKNL